MESTNFKTQGNELTQDQNSIHCARRVYDSRLLVGLMRDQVSRIHGWIWWIYRVPSVTQMLKSKRRFCESAWLYESSENMPRQWALQFMAPNWYKIFPMIVYIKWQTRYLDKGYLILLPWHTCRKVAHTPNQQPTPPPFVTRNIWAVLPANHWFLAPNFEIPGKRIVNPNCPVFLNWVNPNCCWMKPKLLNILDRGQPICFTFIHKQALATARMSSGTTSKVSSRILGDRSLQFAPRKTQIRLMIVIASIHKIYIHNVYIYIYIYIYIYMYTYIYIYMCVYIYIFIYMYAYTHAGAGPHAQTHTYTRMYTQKLKHTYIHTHIPGYIHALAHTHIHTLSCILFLSFYLSLVHHLYTQSHQNRAGRVLIRSKRIEMSMNLIWYTEVWKRPFCQLTNIVNWILPTDESASGTWSRCSHMVVKTPLYCTRKCGCECGCMSKWSHHATIDWSGPPPW